MKKTFITYEQAQKWSSDNNIKTFDKWLSTKRPYNVPSNPQKAYKDQWKGWPSFLGKGWMTFNEARTFIKSRNLSGYTEFTQWRKTTDRPKNFPSNPHVYYGRYWKGYVDFLGNTPLSYLTIKRIVKNIPVTNSDDWTKRGLKRLGIERNKRIPFLCFRGKERFKQFANVVPLEYDKVKDIIKKNKLKTAIQYRFYVRDIKKTNPTLGKQLRIRLDCYPQWKGWLNFKRVNKISS